MNRTFHPKLDVNDPDFLSKYKDHGKAEHLFPEFIRYSLKFPTNAWSLALWCSSNGFDGLLQYLYGHVPQVIGSHRSWQYLYDVAVKNNASLVAKMMETWSVNTTCYAPFIDAVEQGNLANLKLIGESLCITQLQQLIRAYNYEAFRSAASNGKAEILNQLKEWACDEIKNLIKENNYNLFLEAANYGHMNVLNALALWSRDEELDGMIRADDYGAFRNAVDMGHLNVVATIGQWARVDDMRRMLEIELMGVSEGIRAELDKWSLLVV